MSVCKYRRGDWVRFQASGALVIGSVEYVAYEYGGHFKIITDRGTLRDDGVLEHRRAPQSEDEPDMGSSR